jgi:hypothetical protein
METPGRLTATPFGNSLVPRVFFVPKGQGENRPTFQRREQDRKAVSPEGTAEILPFAFCRLSSDQPFLRDLALPVLIPSLEKAGLFSFVPPGHKAANFLTCIFPSAARRNQRKNFSKKQQIDREWYRCPDAAGPSTRSAGFLACCFADFPVGRVSVGTLRSRVRKPAIRQAGKPAPHSRREISGLRALRSTGLDRN